MCWSDVDQIVLSESGEGELGVIYPFFVLLLLSCYFAVLSALFPYLIYDDIIVVQMRRYNGGFMIHNICAFKGCILVKVFASCRFCERHPGNLAPDTHLCPEGHYYCS